MSIKTHQEGCFHLKNRGQMVVANNFYAQFKKVPGFLAGKVTGERNLKFETLRSDVTY